MSRAASMIKRLWPRLSAMRSTVAAREHQDRPNRRHRKLDTGTTCNRSRCVRQTDRQSITICDTNDRQRTDRTDRHLGTDPRRGRCPGASFAAGSWIRLAKPFGTKQPNEGDSGIGPLAADRSSQAYGYRTDFRGSSTERVHDLCQGPTFEGGRPTAWFRPTKP